MEGFGELCFYLLILWFAFIGAIIKSLYFVKIDVDQFWY